MSPQHLTPRGKRVISLAKLSLLFTFVLAVCVAGVVSGTGQSDAKDEREVEEKVAKHLPIKVKLKKPEKVKDRKNEGWVDDFELEVTNTGTKPIYYIYFVLSLPDVIDGGKTRGFQIWYGRVRLSDLTAPIQPEDVPILPGETVTLQIPENNRRAWKSSRAERGLPNPKKLRFSFQLLNYGDGTGLWTPEGVPLPNPQKVGATCREEDGRSAVARNAFASPPGLFPDIASFSTFLPVPVSLRPANFFSGASPAGATTGADICCPGMGPNCARLRPSEQLCICGEAPAISPASCSDPFGLCVTTRDDRRECFDSTGFKHFCDFIEIDRPCSSPMPEPSPGESPPPAPTSTPTPTPEPTPLPSPDCAGQPRPANCCECEYFLGPALPGSPPTLTPGWNCDARHCPENLPLPGGCVTATRFQGIPVCPPGYSASRVGEDGICCPDSLPIAMENCELMGGSWSFTNNRCENGSGGEFNPECPWCLPWQVCRTTGCSSPVVVDVNGDGFRFTDAAHGVLFDITGRNLPARISWTEADADDAWLALDRDGNGRVDGGHELFGNFTAQSVPPAGEERNGFRALAEFDQTAKGGNGDGVIDSRDAVFASLRLWRDANHDGRSQPEELFTLPALDVVRLHLDYKESKRVDEHGNEFRFRAKLDDARGAKVNRWAWDVFLVGAP